MSKMHLIDWSVILIYFVAILLIGKRVTSKVKTQKDYLLAGKTLGKLPTAFSTAMTDFGGVGLIGGSGLVYSIGASGIWWNLSAAPAWIILGFILAGPLRRVALTTVPEFLEKRYDSKTRIIAAILHLAGITITATAQIIVAGLAITTLTGVPKDITVIIATIVFVTYTTFGGLLAVIWIDVLQYIILMLGVLITLPFAINAAGGWTNMTKALPAEFWDMSALGWMEPLAWIVLGFYFCGTNQAFIQKIFAAKDQKTAKFAYIYTGINYIVYAFIIAIIGMAAVVVAPGLQDSEMAFATIIKDALPIGLRGFLIAAILAATMSTSSSTLNAAATIFCIDIYKRLINKNADGRRILRVARWSTVIIAFISLSISFMLKNVIDIVVLASAIYSAGVFLPIVFGLFNKRVNSAGAFSAIISGGSMAVISKLLLYHKVGGLLGVLHPMFVGSFVSLIALLVVSNMTSIPANEKIDF